MKNKAQLVCMLAGIALMGVAFFLVMMRIHWEVIIFLGGFILFFVGIKQA